MCLLACQGLNTLWQLPMCLFKVLIRRKTEACARYSDSDTEEGRQDMWKGGMGNESQGNQLQELFFGAFFHSSSSTLMASES